jgi:hypothetical protein
MGNYKWSIGPSQEHEGWNDHSTSEFGDYKLGSVIRESLQNSIDARIKGSRKPVKVSFEEESYNIRDIIPDYNTWRSHAIKAIREAETENDSIKAAADNALKFINNANNKKIKVFKISDENTVGLQGVKKEKSRFDYLLKRKGSSVNQGVGGGNYGIGKFAPFPLSPISTVIYSTLNDDGEYGYAVKTIIQSYKLETPVAETDRTPLMEFAKGTWWFWDTSDNCGINDKNFIDEMKMLRQKQGTDIFIVGMNDEEGLNDNYSFSENIIREITDNYFIAIKKGLLECNVAYTAKNGKKITQSITKENILFHCNESYKIFSKNSNGYPKAISDAKHKSAIMIQAFENRPHLLNVKNLGKVQLYLKHNPTWENKIIASNHIARCRLNHQTVDFASFGGQMSRDPFVGIMIVKEKRGSDLLGLCEPPRHNKWNPNLITNDKLKKKKARAAIKDFKKQLQEIFNERDRSSSVSREIRNARILIGQVDDPESSLRLEIKDIETDYKDIPPNRPIVEGIPIPPIPPVPPGPPVPPVPPVPPKPPKPIKAAILKRRVTFINDKNYKLVFWASKNINNAGLELFARSEDSNQELRISVLDAFSIDKNGNKHHFDISNNVIIIPNIRKDRNVITVETDRSSKLAIDLSLTNYAIVGDEENE